MRRNATDSVGALQSAHESILAAQPKTKIWLEHGGRFMIGDGGLHLLEGIARSGSLAEAVREIGWSYRHAWGYLRRAEDVLGAPLLVTRPGKGAARGTALTPAGRLLLERLRALRDRIDEALGPTGPTRDEIASRGRTRHRARAKAPRRR